MGNRDIAETLKVRLKAMKLWIAMWLIHIFSRRHVGSARLHFKSTFLGVPTWMSSASMFLCWGVHVNAFLRSESLRVICISQIIWSLQAEGFVIWEYMSGGHNYLLPAMDMALHRLRRFVLPCCLQINRVSVSGWSAISCECFRTNLTIPCPLPTTLAFR